MRLLWVFAHPEERSLSAALRDTGIDALIDDGHEVRLSDLYAIKWDPLVDCEDYGDELDDRLIVGNASRKAYREGTLRADIRAEQDKLLWADAVVFQFPLWWYSVPAILKGWIDRVFVKGFAYGVQDPNVPGRTLRYGEGTLSGKRALALPTIGSPEPAMGPRGINGDLEQVLFPLLHGTFWYTGMSALPPVAVYGSDRVSAEQFDLAAGRVRTAVRSIGETEPIPYRTQNGGDYDADLVLLPELAAGRSGVGVHRTEQSDMTP